MRPQRELGQRVPGWVLKENHFPGIEGVDVGDSLSLLLLRLIRICEMEVLPVVARVRLRLGINASFLWRPASQDLNDSVSGFVHEKGRSRQVRLRQFRVAGDLLGERLRG